MPRAAMKHPYPQNLACEIMCREDLADTLPLDFEECIEYVLENLMDQRKSFILVLRYLHRLSYREIGNYYGLTSQQSRQIVDRALRRLRHPLRFRYLKDGIAQAHPLPSSRESCPPLGMAIHDAAQPDIGDTLRKYKRRRVNALETTHLYSFLAACSGNWGILSMSTVNARKAPVIFWPSTGTENQSLWLWTNSRSSQGSRSIPLNA